MPETRREVSGAEGHPCSARLSADARGRGRPAPVRVAAAPLDATSLGPNVLVVECTKRSTTAKAAAVAVTRALAARVPSELRERVASVAPRGWDAAADAADELLRRIDEGYRRAVERLFTLVGG